PVPTGPPGTAGALTVASRVLPFLVLALLISALAGAGNAVIVGLAVVTFAVTLPTAMVAVSQQRRMAKSLSRLQRAAAGELLPVDGHGGSSDAMTVATDAVLFHLSRAVQLVQSA